MSAKSESWSQPGKNKNPAQKGRAIVEVDTDGGYVLSETQIEESGKVKMFDKFIEDLKKLLNSNGY